jgi:hypothetical protein
MIRFYNLRFPVSLTLLLVSETLLILGCFVAAAFLIFDYDPLIFILDEGGWVRILAVTVVLVAGLLFNGQYAQVRVRSYFQLAQQLCLALGVVFLYQALVAYARLDLVLPKWQMIYAGLLVLATIPLWRMAFAAMVAAAAGAEKVLLVGTSPLQAALSRRMEETPQLGLRPVGFVAETAASKQALPGVHCLGVLADIRDVVAEHKPDRLILGLHGGPMTSGFGFLAGRGGPAPVALPLHDLLDFRYLGIPMQAATEAFEAHFGRVRLEEVMPEDLIFGSEFVPPPATQLQRIYSVLIAAVGLVLSAPVLLLAALAIRVGAGRAVLRRERYVGRHGQVFLRYRLNVSPEGSAIDRFLLRFRLQDLPQLWNVLSGRNLSPHSSAGSLFTPSGTRSGRASPDGPRSTTGMRASPKTHCSSWNTTSATSSTWSRRSTFIF